MMLLVPTARFLLHQPALGYPARLPLEVAVLASVMVTHRLSPPFRSEASSACWEVATTSVGELNTALLPAPLLFLHLQGREVVGEELSLPLDPVLGEQLCREGRGGHLAHPCHCGVDPVVKDVATLG